MRVLGVAIDQHLAYRAGRLDPNGPDYPVHHSASHNGSHPIDLLFRSRRFVTILRHVSDTEVGMGDEVIVRVPDSGGTLYGSDALNYASEMYHRVEAILAGRDPHQ
jgi:hypothetical protein